MPLPSFSVTGNLNEIPGVVVASELLTTALTATLQFTPNIKLTDFVVWEGQLYRVDPVSVWVSGDGSISDMANPVRLLANDDGLNVSGLQWKVTLTTPGGGQVEWWFDAPADGETVDLATVIPVPPVNAVGISRGPRGYQVDQVHRTADTLVFQVQGADLPSPVDISDFVVLPTAAQVANVKAYGAVGDGVTDDTSAIAAAWAASAPAHAIYFPPGDYVYNGAGLDGATVGSDGSVLIARGAGERSARILLGSSSYLFKPSAAIATLVLEDLWIEGGKGAIKQTFTGVDTVGTKHINRVRFYNFTECAVSSEASDSPFWNFDELWVQAANSNSTIGFALSPGLSDVSTFTNCTFQRCRVDIKCGNGGNNVLIDHCDFLSGNTDVSGGARIAVWVVPAPGTNNAGNGFVCTHSGFGAENLVTPDKWIVYADELSGASNGTRMPNLAADSTGIIMGHTISENFLRRSGLFDDGLADYFPPMIYSTTPNVLDLDVHDNQVMDNMSYILEYRTVPTATQVATTRNVFGPVIGWSDPNTIGPKVSNDPAAGYTNDTAQTLQTRPGVVRQNGSGSSASYVECLSMAITSFSAGSATITGTTDAFGGSDAATINITGDFGAAVGNISAFIAGVPCWVEIDVAQPADTPLSGLQMYMFDTPSFAAHWVRTVEIPTTAMGWVTYAFCFTPRSVGTTNRLYLQAPVSTGRGKVKVGRPRVYQSHERILGGRRAAIAAAATDAGTTQTLANDLRAKLIALGLVHA